MTGQSKALVQTPCDMTLFLAHATDTTAGCPTTAHLCGFHGVRGMKRATRDVLAARRMRQLELRLRLKVNAERYTRLARALLSAGEYEKNTIIVYKWSGARYVGYVAIACVMSVSAWRSFAETAQADCHDGAN